MNYEEAEQRRLFNLSGQMNKLGYHNSCITTLYNKHPSLDKIEPTFEYQNPDGSYNHKIVDNQQIGIIPGGLAESSNYCIGDPTDPQAFWRNPHEQEVIEIMGRLLGIPNVGGYLTSGGTEGNLAAIWWCKNNLVGKSKDQIASLKKEIKLLKRTEEPDYEVILKKQKELGKLNKPYLVTTKNSHFSVTKVAGVIELNQLFIEDNPDASMNLNDLRKKLTRLQKYENLNFVVSVNFGTTCHAAFDDIFEVRGIFDELKRDGW